MSGENCKISSHIEEAETNQNTPRRNTAIKGKFVRAFIAICSGITTVVVQRQLRGQPLPNFCLAYFSAIPIFLKPSESLPSLIQLSTSTEALFTAQTILLSTYFYCVVALFIQPRWRKNYITKAGGTAAVVMLMVATMTTNSEMMLFEALMLMGCVIIVACLIADCGSVETAMMATTIKTHSGQAEAGGVPQCDEEARRDVTPYSRGKTPPLPSITSKYGIDNSAQYTKTYGALTLPYPARLRTNPIFRRVRFTEFRTELSNRKGDTRTYIRRPWKSRFPYEAMDPRGSVIGDIRPGARQDPPDHDGGTPRNSNDDRLYHPLNENEIRILEVLPGREEDMIESRLECIKLGNLTSNYNALSYVWGDLNKPKVPLVVNGHVLQVTENCISALKELRREFMARSKTCFIWIDAICINQMDIPERNQQLLAMTRIYRSSRKLIVWLGLESEEIREAIEIMKALPADCDQRGLEGWCESCETNPECLQRWRSIATFFSRSWFSRVWIVQEYLACSQTRISTISEVASENIEFYCGTSRVSPAMLAKILRHDGFLGVTKFDWPNVDLGMQEQINSLYTSFKRGATCFFDILQRAATPLSLSSSEETAHHFLRCIVRGLEYGATEPRDRVYAHLPLQLTWQGNIEILMQGVSLDVLRRFANGQPITRSPIELLSESIRHNHLNFSKLIIDYNRSVEDVYSSLVCFMVFATKSLNILSLCYRRSSHVRRTWTVDLTAASLNEKGLPQAGGLLTDSILNSSSFKSFFASNGAAAEAHFSSDLSVLSVKGYRVATIAMPMGYPEKFGPELQILFLEKYPLKVLLSLLVDLGVYETLQVAQKVLWETMLAGAGFENDLEELQRWCSWLDTDSESFGIGMWDRVICHQLYRRLFLISDGRIGKGWDSIKPGDHVCVILGCDAPLVLRPVEDYYELIGDCYIDGIMEGEATKDSEERNIELETFKLH
ncbi:hypothetical protein G7Y89_g11433 [Cudoniella acicularis]|uniref:Heterokaryon incompatibility domain-containing protein n=1 Tax=Cudoniella acicularis TaxID=354080 RepID=A0A8H4RDI0_9HELO|nr:hypothetical protein G7Y89_g11433 [Cudoniella acicularis]